MHDPTLTSPVTPQSPTLFSKRLNRTYKENSTTTTPLVFQHGVDFEIASIDNALDETWASKFTNRETDSNTLVQASRKYNNVIKEIIVAIRTVK